MHFRVVVLCKESVSRMDVYRIEESLCRRLATGYVDYIDFMEKYSVEEFEKFDEKGYVWYIFSYSGGRLRFLGYGLRLPRGWRKRYREILVFDGHV